MTITHGTLRRVLSIGAVWGILWLAFWLVVGAVIGIVDPDSIDPGEPAGMLAIFAPMGFLSGIAFAGLLLAVARAGTSLFRAAALGTIGTALVQLAYLGHGDQGLLDNLRMALLFSVIGGLVTMAWHGTTRFVVAFTSVLSSRS